MFVLQKTDGKGGYVTPPGSEKSYTHDIANARIFSTREKAEAERCVENEIVVPLSNLLQRPE
jgi:hypothetical protein